ncbi:defensin-like protein 285 [Eutrema salsugineum]|uniref:defensin-like protein 285 n=1 Tax=Eutrema salsugineum TaxID=72664 RepID=UPI000CED66F8|nr:defensin-like protein 285 [Eutrema salsugineum]
MKNITFKLILCVSLVVVAFGQDLAKAGVNHLGICDTDLECQGMRCDRGNGYCDQKDGKCKCPKLQAMYTNRAGVNHLGICDTDLECQGMRCDRGDGYCDQKDGKCKCPK